MIATCRWIEHWCNQVVEYVGRFAAWALFALVLLVFTNVVLRYSFRIGAVWAQELEWHLLAVVASLGIAYTMRHNEHVTVDIFSQRYSRMGVEWMNLLTAVFVVIPASYLIIRYGYPFAHMSMVRGEVSSDPGGLPYRFVPKAFVTVGFVFVLIQGVALALGSAARILEARLGGRR